jgi:hypothetical protein
MSFWKVMLFMLIFAVIFGSAGFASIYWRFARFPGHLRLSKLSGMRLPKLLGLQTCFYRARKGSQDVDGYDSESDPLLLSERDP